MAAEGRVVGAAVIAVVGAGVVNVWQPVAAAADCCVRVVRSCLCMS